MHTVVLPQRGWVQKSKILQARQGMRADIPTQSHVEVYAYLYMCACVCVFVHVRVHGRELEARGGLHG